MRRSIDVTQAVGEFHQTFGLPIRTEPTMGDPGEAELRMALIEEEVGELALAIAEGDLVEIADALGDLIYVTQGAALTFGIDLDAVIAEIHRSNMTKLWDGMDMDRAMADPYHPAHSISGDGRRGYAVYREDGKVLKPPTFEEPEIALVLKGWMRS